MGEKSLEVRDLHAYYGQSHVLQGISLTVKEAECVALLGRNGVGKTTTFLSIAGLMAKAQGHVTLGETSLLGLPPHRIAQSGIVYVPAGRRAFARLTVRDNLQMAVPRSVNKQRAIEDVLTVFPGLRERLNVQAGVLSGGQNQMLKMARALLVNPSFLLLDEPTEGLAPLVVQQMGEHIRQLMDRGVGVLIAEQNARFTLKLSRHLYVLDKGVIKLERTGDKLYDDQEVLSHLGI
ncbi:ABC transporter ATP-binding protein [Sulfobacillus harzensis]|uniref:ABC transporter ATP-binding protein n=1 Tax=Sulfobacillus harzensis TaxID=2729629 RepID=A0A7Y0Q4B7_9FIRM|nr:ABC transporter ATP-binding protein [Sulfobacillus harzensis]NMP23836.1 ABC transporter ATP-binding protein [Sulfobacillus harzensis]